MQPLKDSHGASTARRSRVVIHPNGPRGRSGPADPDLPLMTWTDTAKTAGAAVIPCNASLYNTADAPSPGWQPRGNSSRKLADHRESRVGGDRDIYRTAFIL